jgi:hypothetical protein
MRAAAVLAGAVLAVLAGSAPARAVDEGVPDGLRHPGVGVLAADPDGAGPGAPFLLCSGFVVADDVFLTAAHCIGAMPEGTAWSVTLEPGSPAAPVATPGLFPEAFPFSMLRPTEPALQVVVHPRHGRGEERANDLAVLRMAPGTFAGVPPVRLPERRQLDRLARRGELHGTSFRLVGYGTDPEWGDGEPVFVLEGYRQTATAPFAALGRRWLWLDGDARRTGRGSLCFGDSGSPQLLGDTAVSLLTSHEPTCRGAIRAQRLDTPAARRFLDDHVALP